MYCPRMLWALGVVTAAVAGATLEPAPATAQEVRRVPAQRQVARRAQVTSYVNLSELQYRPVEAGAVIYETGAPSADESGPDRPAGAPAERVAIAARPAVRARPAVQAPGAARVAATPDAKVVRWNTAAGREALGSVVVVDGPLGAGTGVAVRAAGGQARGGEDACVQPTVTKSGSTCCNYRQPDQLNGGDAMYRQPLKVFGSESAARDFAATVRASIPMFLPYHNPDVRASHAWIYNGSDENFHGAVDYGKKSEATGSGIDPAFKVRSVASGVVVSVYWDNWSGNIVIIEHTASNGDVYRTSYKHLRNGFTNDLQMARGLTVKSDERFDKDGNPTNRLKYQRFANLEDPSEQHWGTENQTIRVKVGEKVGPGTLIGWSGNTGPGGAGNGLNDDGTPKNANTANNHLHLMTAVPDPNNAGDWVQVDPYGVYNQISESECYDLLDTTAYVRLFAPFYPSFHNVPAQYVGFYWGYYTGMGMGLQTISLHRKGNSVLASGAFQHGLPKAWYMRMYMTASDYQKWFNEYGGQGFRPREISVTRHSNGNPRFTVIWKKRQGESFAAYHNMTDDVWNAKWKEHVENGGMKVDERAAYRVGNSRRLAAVFVKEGSPGGFYEYHYMTGQAYQSKAEELGAQGWDLVNAEAEELPEGTRFGGIWRKLPGSFVARHGLTPAQYQDAFEDLGSKGYRLYDVQGYDDSGRFIAVWVKP